MYIGEITNQQARETKITNVENRREGGPTNITKITKIANLTKITNQGSKRQK